MPMAPTLRRRMACWLYEGMLLFGVVFLTDYLFSTLTQTRSGLDNRGWQQALLFVVLGWYFVWQWQRTGQTLPMKTWHIQLVDAQTGKPPGTWRAAWRYTLCWVWFLPPLALAGVLALAPEAMRAAGLSARKIDYLVDLARHFESGDLHVEAWHDMDDESIIQELVAIRGIGRWTAEMFLIFYLLRPNVLPLDDAGLIRGISEGYFSGEPVSRSEAREVAAAWSPYCSVATWYIWRSLDPVPAAT